MKRKMGVDPPRLQGRSPIHLAHDPDLGVMHVSTEQEQTEAESGPHSTADGGRHQVGRPSSAQLARRRCTSCPHTIWCASEDGSSPSTGPRPRTLPRSGKADGLSSGQFRSDPRGSTQQQVCAVAVAQRSWLPRLVSSLTSSRLDSTTRIRPYEQQKWEDRRRCSQDRITAP